MSDNHNRLFLGNLLAGAMTTGAGAFFLWGALAIPRQPGVLGGPHVVPMTASLLLVVLGLVMLALALRTTRASAEAPAETTAPGAGAQTAAEWPGLLPVAFVAGGLVYVWMIGALGYLPASLIAAPFAFAAFGARGPARTLLGGLVAVGVIYLIFFQTLGLYDPPGRLMDWRALVGGG